MVSSECSSAHLGSSNIHNTKNTHSAWPGLNMPETDRAVPPASAEGGAHPCPVDGMGRVR